MYCFLLLCCASCSPDDVQRFLEELGATRSFSNGEISYEVTWTEHSTSPRVESGTHRFYGQDDVFTMHSPVIGADDVPAWRLPYTRRARIGPYQVSNSGSALSSVISDNGYDFDDPIWDFRQVGLMPDIHALESGDQAYLRRHMGGRDADVQIRRESDGDLLLTRLRLGDERELLIWRDPKRADQVVRSQLRSGGAVAAEARVKLARFGGHWFPSKVEYYRGTPEGLQRYVVARIKQARFDDPAMQPLTLADAGIDVGTVISKVNGREDMRNPVQSLSWDGQAIVEAQEVHHRILAGELTVGPQVQRDRALNRLAQQIDDPQVLTPTREAVAEQLSRWRMYTLRFIKRYELNDEQSQKAMEICDDCERKAGGVVERMADRLADVGRMRDDLLGAALAGADSELLRSYVSRRQEILDRIDSIFEDELKPRLDRLLTRSQRARATESGKEKQSDP